MAAVQKYVLGFEMGPVLGRGGFGFVKEASLNGNTYAMKIVEKGGAGWNSVEEKMVRDEIVIMEKLNHPNIIKVISHKMDGKYPREDGTEDDCVLIVMELARGGNLFDILFFTEGFDETVTRTYLTQLISALGAMHDLGICHRDIKPQNTLLDSNYNVKICDFGLSKETDGASLMTTTLGTRPFQAPEMIMRRDYDFGVDVFALGVCYFLMLTGGVPPFKEATVNDKWFKCIAGKAEEKFWKRHKAAKKKILKTCGEDGFQNATSLFFWMCAYQPTERATITDCHGHDWFNGPKTEGEALKTMMKKIVDVAMEKKKEDPELGGEVSKRVRAMCMADLDMDAEAPAMDKFVPNFTYEIIEDHPYIIFKSIEDFLDQNGIPKDDVKFDPETFEMSFQAQFANNLKALINIYAYREGETNYLSFQKVVGSADTAPNMLISKVVDKHCQQLGDLKQATEAYDKPVTAEMIDDVLKHMEKFAGDN